MGQGTPMGRIFPSIPAWVRPQGGGRGGARMRLTPDLGVVPCSEGLQGRKCCCEALDEWRTRTGLGCCLDSTDPKSFSLNTEGVRTVCPVTQTQFLVGCHGNLPRHLELLRSNSNHTAFPVATRSISCSSPLQQSLHSSPSMVMKVMSLQSSQP